VVLALLISGDIMVGMSPVPSELILFRGGYIDILKVSIGLLSAITWGTLFRGLRAGIGICHAHQAAQNLKKYI
jgi:hypothetical protein